MMTKHTHTRFQKEAPDRSPLATVVVRELLAGSLVSLFVMVMNVGAAGIVFSEGGPFRDYVGDALTICFLTTFVGSVGMYLFSACPAIISADAFMAAFFVTMAANLIDGHGTAAPFGTVSVAIALTSAMQGLSFYLLGWARVGRAVQYVPTPVISGYLASIGYLLLAGTSRMLVTRVGVKPMRLNPYQPELSSPAPSRIVMACDSS